MLDQQTQPEPVKNNSTIKWTALGIGGCLVLIACLALALVLTAIYLQPEVGGIFSQIISGVKGTPNVTRVNTASPAVGSLLQTKFNTLGDPNAPVKIIEYADFQCPYCRQYWQETEPQIINTYVATGKVFYEYRSVGAFIGPDSASAAEAAYCAADQNKFWEYHDTLYSNWTGENTGDFAPEKLRQYARTVGLNQNTFDKCVSQHKYAGQVQQDVKNAKADGIESTPSFLINGKIVQGAQPFDVFQQAIDSALKGN
jgi:protein-disulfide isomerase